MKLKLIVNLLFAWLMIAMTGTLAANNTDMYPFPSKQQQAQFNHLLKELRCLVCQNQNLADSNANLALDLKQQVYQQVLEGQSDKKIIEYMTERYGDFILFKPPVKAVTLLLWAGPLVFLLIGFILFALNFKTKVTR